MRFLTLNASVICALLLLSGVPALAAEPAAAAAPGTVALPLPDPVPGYPIGWCIRARPEVFADAKSAGFEFVELALQDVLGLSDEAFTNLVADLERLNLRALSGYNSIPRDFKLVGSEVDDARLDAHVERLITRASALKLTYLILNAGGSWRVPDDFPRERAFEQLTAFGRRFAEAAGRRNITVLIEPLRGTDSNQLTNSAEAVRLVQAVNHPNFQMMVDYSFFTIQQENPKALLAAGKHLRHVHIANPAANRTYPMSDSDSDYASFFAVLKEIGYRGGISVHGGTQSFTNDAPRAIRFLRSKAGALRAQ